MSFFSQEILRKVGVSSWFYCSMDIKKPSKFLIHTVQNSKKKNCSLSVLCSPRIILTRPPQISGQNKSETREQEGLVKITYGIVASSLFKRAGNSNYEKILNCVHRILT